MVFLVLLGVNEVLRVIVALRFRKYVLLFYLFLLLKAEVGISALAVIAIIGQPQSTLLTLRVEFLVLVVFLQYFCGFVVRNV